MKNLLMMVTALLCFNLLSIAAIGQSDGTIGGQQSGLEADKAAMQKDLNDMKTQVEDRIKLLNTNLAKASDEGKVYINQQKTKMDDAKSDLTKLLEEITNVTLATWEDFQERANKELEDTEGELAS